MDAAFVSHVQRKRRSSAASCARVQPRELSAHTATPEAIANWSLTSLREKLIKIGARVVSHGRYVTFQMAEVAIPRTLSVEILNRISALRSPPLTAP